MSVVRSTILELGRIVMNFISYFYTIFVGYFDMGASREVIPTEVRSPDIVKASESPHPVALSEAQATSYEPEARAGRNL